MNRLFRSLAIGLLTASSVAAKPEDDHVDAVDSLTREEQASRAFDQLPEYSDELIERVVRVLKDTEFPASFASLEDALLVGRSLAYRSNMSAEAFRAADGRPVMKNRVSYQLTQYLSDGAFYALLVEFLPQDGDTRGMIKSADLYYVSPGYKWFRYSDWPLPFPRKEANPERYDGAQPPS